MLARYAVVEGVDLSERQRGTGRYLLEKLVATAPLGSVEAEVIGRWAEMVDDSPRLIWHAAEAYATWAHGFGSSYAETARLFDRAALYAYVQFEWSSARRAEARREARRERRT